MSKCGYLKPFLLGKSNGLLQEINIHSFIHGSKPKFWSKYKVSLLSLDAGVGFLDSERKVSCLEATSLPSEDSLELFMAMSSNSTLREVSLQDCLVDQVEPTLLPMALSNRVNHDEPG